LRLILDDYDTESDPSRANEIASLVRATRGSLRTTRDEIDRMLRDAYGKIVRAGLARDAAELNAFLADFGTGNDAIDRGVDEALANRSPASRHSDIAAAREALERAVRVDRRPFPHHAPPTDPDPRRAGDARFIRQAELMGANQAGGAPSTLTDATAAIVTAAAPPSDPASPEYVAATIDVQITQDIRDLAARLGNSPRRIYEYVREHIEYEPYFGSRKGSQATLDARRGNDVDISSLTLALLRAANVPSRYVRGTVELPTQRVLDWMGARNPAAPLTILRFGSVGSKALGPDANGDGEPDPATLQTYVIDRWWVEAFVPYSEYRGAGGGGGATWIPLDPSFKQHRFTGGLPGVADGVIFNEDAYFSRRPDPDRLAHEVYARQVRDWLNAHPDPTVRGSSLEAVPYRGDVVPDRFSMLPGSLPYRVRSIRGVFSSVPNSPQNNFDICRTQAELYLLRASDDFILLHHQLEIPEVATKRVTISWTGSGTSSALTTALGTEAEVPLALTSAGRPILKVDGQARAQGTIDINAGTVVVLRVYMWEPHPETADLNGNGIPEPVGILDPDFNSGTRQCNQSSVPFPWWATAATNDAYRDYPRTAGTDFETLVFQARQASETLLARRGRALVDASADPSFPANGLDPTLGEFLNVVGLRFFQRLEQAGWATHDLTHYRITTYVNHALVTGQTPIVAFFDRPFGTLPNVAHFDLRRNYVATWSIDEDPITWNAARRARLFRLLNLSGSALEHAIWEEVLHVDAVSTVKGFQYANETNINPGGKDVVTLSANPAHTFADAIVTTKSQLLDKLCHGASGTPVMPAETLSAIWADLCVDANRNDVCDTCPDVNGDGSCDPLNSHIKTTWCTFLYHDWRGATWASIRDDGSGSWNIKGQTEPQASGGGQTAQPLDFASWSTPLVAVPVHLGRRLAACSDAQGKEWVDGATAQPAGNPPDRVLSLIEEARLNRLLASTRGTSLRYRAVDCGGVRGRLYAVSGSSGDPGYFLQPVLQGGSISFLTLYPDPLEPIPEIWLPEDPGVFIIPLDPIAHSPDPVNFSNGELWFQTSDLDIPDRGFGVNFTRTYGSQSDYQGILGPGWTHSYNEHLTENADLTVTWFDDSGTSLVFTRSGPAYVPPVGVFSTLTRTTSGWEIRDSSQFRRSFDASGHLVALGDTNGNQQTFTYLNGVLDFMTDTAGRLLDFRYDSLGRLERLVDWATPTPRQVVFTYNPAGELESATDVDQKTTHYTYYSASYAQHNLKTIIDPEGHTTTYEYYYNDKCYRVLEPENRITTLIYRPLRDQTLMIDPRGYEWAFGYDGNGSITEIIDPKGDIWSSEFENETNRCSLSATLVAANRCSVTDQAGNTTSFTYDDRGNLLTVRNPGTVAPAVTESYTYDPTFNLATSYRDARGHVTTYGVNTATGNLDYVVHPRSSTDPADPTTRFEYYPDGLLKKMTDPEGKATFYEYDPNGYLRFVTGAYHRPVAERQTWTTNRDSVGRVTSTIDPANNVTTYTTDAHGRTRTVSKVNSSTLAIEYQYDDDGNLRLVRDALNQSRILGYDGMHNQISEQLTDRNGATVSATLFGRNHPECGCAASDLTSYTDNAGLRTTFVYDPLGRLLSETDPLGHSTRSEYDSRGNLIRRIDPRNRATRFTFDNLRRMRTVTADDGSLTNFDYDAAGNLTTAANQYTTVTRTYDPRNRLQTEQDSLLGKTITTVYDMAGNRKSIDVTGIGQAIYHPDPLNRVDSVTGPYQQDGTFFITYTPQNHRDTLRYPNGVVADYSYDPEGWLTGIVHSGTVQPAGASVSYGLDAVGRRESMGDFQGQHNYSYDGVGHLEDAWHPVGADERYTYDATGRRLTSSACASFSYADNSVLLEECGESFVHDQAGNRTEQRSPVGPANYTYDDFNRLVRIVLPDLTTIDHRYDALGRRIARIVNGGQTTRYFYDRTSIVAEYDGVGNLLASYLYGPEGADDLLRMRRGGQSHYYHADGLGSILAITNANGYIEQRYSYDTFGNPADPVVPGIENDFRYVGRPLDPLTGLYDMRARFYDPGTGRFLSRDPLGVQEGPDPYAYAHNDPVNLVDPTGFGAEVPKGWNVELIGPQTDPYDTQPPRKYCVFYPQFCQQWCEDHPMNCVQGQPNEIGGEFDLEFPYGWGCLSEYDTNSHYLPLNVARELVERLSKYGDPAKVFSKPVMPNPLRNRPPKPRENIQSSTKVSTGALIVAEIVESLGYAIKVATRCVPPPPPPRSSR
jgi:RHS repeat-associated protein